MASAAAALAAANEQPSMEVCLDRLDDVSQNSSASEKLIYGTAVDAQSSWPSQLSNVGVQKVTQIVKSARSSAYSLPGRDVLPTKVLRIHTQDVLAKAKKSSAKHSSVMDAIIAVSGKAGEEVKRLQQKAAGLVSKLNKLEEKKAMLESEADQEGTSEARQGEIDAKVEELDVEMETIQDQIDPAEDELFEATKNLATISISDKDKKLAGNLFRVVQHAAILQNSNIESLVRVLIHVPQAVPNLPSELPEMAKRWLEEAAKEQLGNIGNPGSLLSIDIGSDGISISVNVEDQTFVDAYIGRVKRFFEQALNAPGTMVVSLADASFNYEFLEALGTATGSWSGNEFSPSLTIEIN